MFDVLFRLSLREQNQLVIHCEDIIKKAPLFQKTLRGGAKFKYLCTSAGEYGWISDNKGFRYVNRHPLTQETFPEIPSSIQDIVERVAKELHQPTRPESMLINWYTESSSLGLHIDKTEKCDAPVISISLGDDCLFVKGGLKKSDAKETITLHSGDVFVMSGEERYCYHGVKKIIPNTAPKELMMTRNGRFNITIRQVYT
ncbi:MAG: alpha-ketoglutarate-dependent dioxygenase AlkB [Chloroflexota bacterium]